ncbi:MAG: IS110 family RNA-guided transposase [Thermoplasmata archaeon]
MWPHAPEPPLENALYVGIDVSQGHLDAAVVDCRGNLIRTAQRYENTGPGFENLWDDAQALGRSSSVRPVAYAMEASGIYHLGLLAFLLEKKARTWSFNPLLLQGEKQSRVRKTKTDALDAELIAQFARKEGHRHRPATLDDDSSRLREHCRVRFRLVEKAADTKRQLRRDLDVLCPRLSAEFSDIGTPMALAVLKAFAQITHRFTATVEEIEEALRPFYHASEGRHRKAVALAKHFEDRRAPEALEEPLLWEVKALVHQLELFEEQIRQTEGRIEREMAERKSLVTTVPGIGSITAAIIESELGDAKRFENANQVRAFAGLDPSVYQSGKFEGNRGHISKRGSPRLREGLYRAALSASRANPACRDLYERLMAKGKAHRSALTAVSAKLLVQSWAVLREGKSFEVPERYRVAEPERTNRCASSSKKSEESATA